MDLATCSANVASIQSVMEALALHFSLQPEVIQCVAASLACLATEAVSITLMAGSSCQLQESPHLQCPSSSCGNLPSCGCFWTMYPLEQAKSFVFA
mmetsp:Transcript_42252/g.83601  ORF Transcript_42252/g.83601 Transcript_42252/m.83601 type:complete len:96 (+) Transcript_42252:296-583(+)